MNQRDEDRQIQRVALYAILVNVALAALRGWLAHLSGSLAVIAITIDAAVDVVAALLLWGGLKLSVHKSRTFPYGLYKLENVIQVLVALLIFVVAAEIVRQAVTTTGAAAASSLVVIGGMAFSTVAVLALSLYMAHEGKRFASPGLLAEARHRWADLAASGVVFLALLSGYLGLPVDRPAAGLVAAFIIYSGWGLLRDGMKVLLDASVPYFDCPNKAMAAFAALRQSARFSEVGCKVDFEPYTDVDKKKAQQIIATARAAGRKALTEPEAKDLFACYRLPVTKSSLAKTEDDAARMAQEIGFPIVLKIVSPDILHKSDAGGVRVNLKDTEAVRMAFRTILENVKKYKADAEIHGILVCEMAPLGSEVICGSVNDSTFGPTVMFGLGGVFVEVLKDVTFRVAPISIDCALGMQQEIKGYPMLQGVRGEKRRDQEALAVVISRLSQLVADLDDEIAETDANPILLYEEGKGCRVVDARVILKQR